MASLGAVYLKALFYQTFLQDTDMDISHHSPDDIRAVILQFINQRLQEKLSKLKADEIEKRDKLMAEYEQHAWLEKAANLVLRIQQVTHAAKYSHPYTKGSGCYSTGNPQVGDEYLGTHSLKQIYPDVVGDAAALYVYKFLKLSVGDVSLLELAMANSAEFCAAMSEDQEQASAWVKAFASLPDETKAIASHTFSKQLYWPLEADDADPNYHLISPLFSSALAQEIWTHIREHRFSEEAKAARDARFNKAWSDQDSFEYPNMVVQKFGGSNQQNVSQLNSNRYGENYLLASLPPHWNADLIRPPLKVDSVFPSVFGRRRDVRAAVKDLVLFLEAHYHPDRPVLDSNNMEIRELAREKVRDVIDEFFHFSASVWDLKPGWSAEEDCNLPEEECCWLDQGRVLIDEEFAKTYRWGDWKEQVAVRFANWLNARLASGKKKLPVGKAEFDEWKKLVEKEINHRNRVTRIGPKNNVGFAVAGAWHS